MPILRNIDLHNVEKTSCADRNLKKVETETNKKERK